MTSYTYQYTEPDDDAALKHVENEEEEAAIRQRLAQIIDEDNVIAANAEALKQAQRVKICSCGMFTCGLIKIYGHPVPLYKSDIEILHGQHRRDKRALELKGES